MDLKTKSMKKITDFNSYITEPSFSHDGKKIVFINVKDVATNKGEYELWLINSDGSNPKCIEVPELKIHCSP
jgi:Tol biopolymer transport system component